MDSPKTLLEAIQWFSDEQVCINAVADMRWPNGVTCPECKTGDPYYLKTQKRWKCRECRIQFSVKRGSIFEDSPISLTKWLPALWLIVNCKNGVSSYELSKSLGVTQKSAWFMLHRLRLAMKNCNPVLLGTDPANPVEVDETYVGGKPKNMHTDKRLKMKTSQNGYAEKAIVIGMLARGTREVRAKVIPNAKRETLQREILDNVGFGSTVYTDGWVGYDGLKRAQFVHETVNHMEEYVRGTVHTQGIENFWALLKRSLGGTYVAVEPFHLDRYLDGQAFRYNNRATKGNPLNDSDRFLLALSQVADRRLTYAELTGKESLRPF